MDLDALFRMPMTRKLGDGGLRPFACDNDVGALFAEPPCGLAHGLRPAPGLDTGR